MEFRHNFLIYKHPIAGYNNRTVNLGLRKGGGGGGGGRGRIERGGHVYSFSFSRQKIDYIVTLSKHVGLELVVKDDLMNFHNVAFSLSDSAQLVKVDSSSTIRAVISFTVRSTP